MIMEWLRARLGLDGAAKDHRETVRADAHKEAHLAIEAAGASKVMRDMIAADQQYDLRLRGKGRK